MQDVFIHMQDGFWRDVQDVASQMNMPRFMCIQDIRVLADGLG